MDPTDIDHESWEKHFISLHKKRGQQKFYYITPPPSPPPPNRPIVDKIAPEQQYVERAKEKRRRRTDKSQGQEFNLPPEQETPTNFNDSSTIFGHGSSRKRGRKTISTGGAVNFNTIFDVHCSGVVG